MKYSIYFLFILLIASCQKDSILTNVVVEDNTAPPYKEVTTVQIQNYVNKIFIDLLGREPLDHELSDITNLLKANSLSPAIREQVLDVVMSSDEYYNRLYEIYQISYLPGVTTEEINIQIYLYQQGQNDAIQAGNTLLAQYVQLEIDKLTNLLQVKEDYQNGSITISEFMQRICHNPLYDEINMGSENFVLACFENFLKRLPTECPPIDPGNICEPREKENSILMVEGEPAQLFLHDGTSKGDFVKIITTIPEFYQGLTIDIYQSLLARLPSSEEMGNAILLLEDIQDYQAIQKIVLKSDEYARF